MPISDTYRLSNRLDLAPSYLSLGFPPEAFVDGGAGGGVAFDASLSTATDILWLFKGEDVLAYDLRTDKVVQPPTPISQVIAPGALPESFSYGIDSAVWGGPAFPGLVCLFRGDQFVRFNCRPDPSAGELPPSQWQLEYEPTPTDQEWLRQPSPDGVVRLSLNLEPSAKLYGLRNDDGRVHFLSRDGQYARHNLNNGEADVGPVPVGQRFPLPESFSGRVDLAFYGAGAAAEHIFFFSGFQFAEYDIRRNLMIRTGAIEERFPELALYTARPQLFLVEEYALDTYIGPLTLGGVVSTLSMPPQSRRSSVMITQIVTQASTIAKQNLLESHSGEAVTDFYKKMDRASQSEASSESYQYRLNALFHGDAQAHGLWGGEVNAKLAVNGGSDEQRERLAKQAFDTVATQTRESAQTVNRRLVDTQDASSITQNVYSKESFENSNDTDHVRQIEFMELIQPFLTLLVLKNIKAAYCDGTRAPEVFALAELPQRLPRLLADPADVDRLLGYVKSELSRIRDSSGEMRAIVAPGTLEVDGRVKTQFALPSAGGDQTIDVWGIVKAARDWLQPTDQVRAIQLDDGGARSERVIEPSRFEVLGP